MKHYLLWALVLCHCCEGVAADRNAIQNEWDKRTSQVTSVRLRWKETVTCFAGAIDGRHPAVNVSFERVHAVVITADAAKHTREGPGWVMDQRAFVPGRFEKNLDQNQARSLSIQVGLPTRPSGAIFTSQSMLAANDYHTRPAFLAFRPSAVGLTGVDLRDWQISSETVNIENHACCQAVLEEGGLTHCLWLDPGLGYLPRRMTLDHQGRVISDLTMRYRDDASVGVVPDSWEHILSDHAEGEPTEILAAQVTDVAVNTSIAPTEAAIVFPAGAVVQDNRDGRQAVVLNDGSLRYVLAAEKAAYTWDELMEGKGLPEASVLRGTGIGKWGEFLRSSVR